MYYLVEIIRDVDGIITDRKIVNKSEAPVYKRGGEFINVRAADIPLSHASISVNGEDLSIVTDQTKVDAELPEKEISLRIQRAEFGKRIIAIMSIRNDAKGLDATQLQTLMANYATINQLLLNGSIGTAGSLINAVTPDGVLTTDADKAALLTEINNNLAGLGYS